jgi:hypothetical protein
MERNREEWWKERLNNRLHIGAIVMNTINTMSDS